MISNSSDTDSDRIVSDAAEHAQDLLEKVSDHGAANGRSERMKYKSCMEDEIKAGTRARSLEGMCGSPAFEAHCEKKAAIVMDFLQVINRHCT